MLFEVSLCWGCLYLCKAALSPCVEYCHYVWAGAPVATWILMDKLQIWVCRTAGPAVPAPLEPLAHHRKCRVLVFSTGITLVNINLEWLNLLHIFISWKTQPIYYSKSFHVSITIPRSYKDSNVNSFFLLQQGSRSLCLQNAFLWHMIEMA